MAESTSQDSFLIAIDDTINDLSISVERENTVLVSGNNIGIKIYEVLDQQCIKNWTTPAALKFTGNVVQDPLSKRYFGITKKNTINSWRHSSLDITSNQKTFEGTIQQLHVSSIERKKWAVAVIMENQGIQLIDTKMKIITTFTPESPNLNKVVWSQVKTIDDNDYVFLVCSTSAAYSLHVFTIYNEPSIKERCSFFLRENNKQTHILSCCFQSESPQYFTTIWSDFNFDVWQFESMAQLISESTHQKKFSLAFEPFSLNKAKKGVQLVPLSSSLIGLVGTRHNSLELYICSANWGTVLSHKGLKTLGNDNICEKAVFFANQNMLVLALSKSLCVCPITSSRSGTLASAIGSLTTTTSLLKAAPTAPIHTDAHLSVLLHDPSFASTYTVHIPDDYVERVTQQNEVDTRLVELLTNRTTTATYEQFLEAFLPYIKSRARLVNQNPTVLTQGRESVFTGSNATKNYGGVGVDYYDEKANLTPYFVKAVAARCLEDKFWDPLKYFIRSESLSYQALGAPLIENLMKENHLELLRLCITNMSDITEETLVNLLSYFLKHKNESLMKKYVAKLGVTNEITLNFPFVNLIVNQPINEAFITTSLHRVELKYIIELLQYLSQCLSYHSQSLQIHKRKRKAHYRPGQEKVKEDTFSQIPPFDNILSWTTIIFDSHLTTFMLTTDKECAAVLRQIKVEIQEQIEICKVLQPMNGWLLHLINLRPVPKPSLQNYGVEPIFI